MNLLRAGALPQVASLDIPPIPSSPTPLVMVVPLKVVDSVHLQWEVVVDLPPPMVGWDLDQGVLLLIQDSCHHRVILNQVPHFDQVLNVVDKQCCCLDYGLLEFVNTFLTCLWLFEIYFIFFKKINQSFKGALTLLITPQITRF